MEAAQLATNGPSDAGTSVPLQLDETPAEVASGEATDKANGPQLESVLVELSVMPTSEPTKPIIAPPGPETGSGSVTTFATGNKQRKRNHVPETKVTASVRK